MLKQIKSHLELPNLSLHLKFINWESPFLQRIETWKTQCQIPFLVQISNIVSQDVARI
jgi:hypothetical protein